ncbi:MAG TPA: ATP-binding protein [Bacteroidetes bacterium]|nr:ATP-binding protein [Bacteroidota bacterium]
MENLLIGRKEEQRILQQALASKEAEMVAIIGRRRVGKTFLVNEVYKDQIAYEVTGIQNAPRSEQISNFVYHINRRLKAPLHIPLPSNWLNAFMLLISYLEQPGQAGKKVVFFDELSWLATTNSGFLRALGFFWNSWAVKQNVVVVICGSAASWMIKKVVNNRGGLHNRITKRIFLQPFNLSETEEYLRSRKLRFERQAIAEIYMAMGGIPHYLKEIETGKSAVQNIDHICFSQNGLLKEEFSRLYSSLFAHPERHLAIIRALAGTRQGMTRKKVVETAKLAEGGNTSQVLQELEQSGFISSYFPFGKKKKDMLYRLTDEYSLFYLQFIERNKQEGPGTWQHLSQTQPYKIWSGYAFENICLKHIPQIKKALGIAGIYSTTSTFYKKGTGSQKGTQIDLLIDRNDRVINVFEIKFRRTELTITAAYAKALREKLRVFQETTKTRKYLMLSLISASGLKHNMHSLGLIEKVLTLDDLFDRPV